MAPLFLNPGYATGYLVSKHLLNYSAMPPAIPELRKGGTSARAQVQMYRTLDLGNMHRYLVSKRTPNLVIITRGIPEL